MSRCEALERLDNWWKFGPQERPCILLYGVDHEYKNNDNYEDINIENYWLSPEVVYGRIISNTKSTRYFGEALPYAYIDLGASALAGMMGGLLQYRGKETIWIDPILSDIEVLDFHGWRDTSFAQKSFSLLESLCKKLGEKFIVAPFCIGSACDNLASIMGIETFIYSLIDRPDEISDILTSFTCIWHSAFTEVCDLIFNKSISSDFNLMTGWHGIAAKGSTFPIQEDISYVLSPEMFERFCIPEIVRMANAMDYPFYHLDGIGALPHLSSLLKIEELNVIQWQPGVNNMSIAQWYPVINRILHEKKSCQIYIEDDEIEDLTKNIDPRGMLLICYTDYSNAEKIAKKYNLNENI